MALEKALYTAKVCTTGSCKHTLIKPLLRLVFVTLLAVQAPPNVAWAQSASGPSNSRRYWKSSVIYRQLTRRSDTFRRGSR